MIIAESNFTIKKESQNQMNQTNQGSDFLPELRFPEFANAEEWDEYELGEISEIVRGGSPRPIHDYLTTDNDGLNWLKIADVASDSKYIIGTKEKVIKQAISSTREVNPGDLILSNSMSFGRPYILKITTCIHDGWIAIRRIAEITFEDYLYYFILAESSQNYFQTNAAGAAVKNLNADIIKLLPIFLPKNTEEQQKIASCLSSLDEVIATHSQKLEALKDHKKGLMQTLFPQEGETVPKYRFPEFENDGEWVEKNLGEVCKMQAGKFVSASEIKDKFTEGLYPCYGGNGLRGYTISFTHTGTYSLIGRQGALCGNVNLVDGKFHATEHAVVVTPDESVHTIWLFYVLELLNLNQYATGQAQPGLSVNNLEQVKLYLPENPNEQEKIASCLSSLDAFITAQVDKIEQLKLHKKGLMQCLFPKAV